MRSIDGVKKFHTSAAIAIQTTPWGNTTLETRCRSVATGRGGQSSIGDTMIGTSGS